MARAGPASVSMRESADTLDQLLGALAAGDELGDRDTIRRPCSSAKAVTCGPRMTVPSSLTSSASTPTGGKPASRQRSIAASVWPERMSTPPFAGDQREDMARADEIGRAGVGIGERADRRRPLLGGDAGGDAMAEIDRHGEGGAYAANR